MVGDVVALAEDVDRGLGRGGRDVANFLGQATKGLKEFGTDMVVRTLKAVAPAQVPVRKVGKGKGVVPNEVASVDPIALDRRADKSEARIVDLEAAATYSGSAQTRAAEDYFTDKGFVDQSEVVGELVDAISALTYDGGDAYELAGDKKLAQVSNLITYQKKLLGSNAYTGSDVTLAGAAFQQAPSTGLAHVSEIITDVVKLGTGAAYSGDVYEHGFGGTALGVVDQAKVVLDLKTNTSTLSTLSGTVSGHTTSIAALQAVKAETYWGMSYLKGSSGLTAITCGSSSTQNFNFSDNICESTVVTRDATAGALKIVAPSALVVEGCFTGSIEFTGNAAGGYADVELQIIGSSNADMSSPVILATSGHLLRADSTSTVDKRNFLARTWYDLSAGTYYMLPRIETHAIYDSAGINLGSSGGSQVTERMAVFSVETKYTP
jgi:hypothetical protein